MDNEYRHSKTTVSLVNYHFVFCPRYFVVIPNELTIFFYFLLKMFFHWCLFPFAFLMHMAKHVGSPCDPPRPD